MSKILNFTKRNFKELLREPIICIFCLAFPIIMLALFQIINNLKAGFTQPFLLEKKRHTSEDVCLFRMNYRPRFT